MILMLIGILWESILLIRLILNKGKKRNFLPNQLLLILIALFFIAPTEKISLLRSFGLSFLLILKTFTSRDDEQWKAIHPVLRSVLALVLFICVLLSFFLFAYL
jgi:hypothetical protein